MALRANLIHWKFKTYHIGRQGGATSGAAVEAAAERYGMISGLQDLATCLWTLTIWRKEFGGDWTSTTS